MNFEQEYNKLFEYFSNKTQEAYRISNRTQDTYRIKTSDDLIEEFENNYYIESFVPNDYELYEEMQMEKEHKVLEDLTLIIETVKLQLKELINLNQQELWKKVEDMITLCETRESIFHSENDEPPERPEGFEFIKPKILEPKFQAEETIQDNEIPDW